MQYGSPATEQRVSSAPPDPVSKKRDSLYTFPAASIAWKHQTVNRTVDQKVIVSIDRNDRWNVCFSQKAGVKRERNAAIHPRSFRQGPSGRVRVMEGR